MGTENWTRREVVAHGLLVGAVTMTEGLNGCARRRSADAGGPGSGSGAAPAPPRVLTIPAFVEKGRTWEPSLSLEPGIGNPFDPAEVDLSCALRSPSGRSLTIAAFYYQGYTRSQDAGGAQVLQPLGAPEWLLRFAPQETGLWTYVLSYRYRNATPVVLARGDLEVSEASGPGYVGVDPADPHRFVDLRSGQPYLPVGENLCWADRGGTYDDDRWLGKLSAVGANYIRLWVNEGRFTLGFEQRAPVGDYRSGMDHAWELDYILQESERLGIRAVLCLLWHGAFSTRVNPDWGQNPYNAANGGPCATPADFFTNAKAREFFQRRLRYLVARWSASTSVLAWELWNEVNWVDGYASAPVAAWHQEMSAYLKTIDPAEHMVTTSYNDVTGDPQVWSLPTIDYVQMHDYNFPTVVEPISQYIAGARQRYAKPLIFGEFGIDWRSGANEVQLDPKGHSLHDALWAAVFAGGAGTAMTWWWDSYVDALDLYPVFQGLARVIATGGLGALRPAAGPSAQGFRVDGQTGIWALVDGAASRWVLWIKDLTVHWQTSQAERAEGRTIVLPGFPDRPARVRWLHTDTGLPLSGSSPTVRTGPDGLFLAVPGFTRDIAAILDLAER